MILILHDGIYFIVGRVPAVAHADQGGAGPQAGRPEGAPRTPFGKTHTRTTEARCGTLG